MWLERAKTLLPQNAAFTCRRLLEGALKARRAVALKGDQT
jgi:hypothetical protein